VISEKFIEIFNWYEGDLEAIQEIYEKHKVRVAHLTKCYNSTLQYTYIALACVSEEAVYVKAIVCTPMEGCV